MKYAFIQSQQRHYPVQLMCDVVAVGKSGYYRWSKQPESQRTRANHALDVHIKASFTEHKQRYGSPRLTAELREQGHTCSENRVASRMNALGIHAKTKRKYKATTNSKHNLPVAPNLLAQNFRADKPNQKWVSDITYIWTEEGWLYLAVVMDLYSRMVIGYAMNKRMDKQLVIDALRMALFRRKFPRGVIVHSDRGSQYCSHEYQKLLHKGRLICSMSKKGDCYDNAAMESWNHSLKTELVHGERYATRLHAEKSITEYIEFYYNVKRRHSANGQRSPLAYELTNAA